MRSDVLLIGLGAMGKAYAAVLKALQVPTVALGRSVSGAEAFSKNTGAEAHGGGFSTWLNNGGLVPRQAIVCVPVEETSAVVRALVDAGVKRLLVEKPGATTPRELGSLARHADSAGAEVLIAYNRRFYASVAEARRRIESEGGVDSFHFEFTERESDVNSDKFSPEVKKHWGLANSSHVIDLAFYLGGQPNRLTSEVSGPTSWHPSGTQFAGCGKSEQGALFSYCANWTSGGRWSVEVMTRESRLILRPLEQLFVQRRGSFEVSAVALDNKLDTEYKPGLYQQTKSFLSGEPSDQHISLKDQAIRAEQYLAKITGEAREE